MMTCETSEKLKAKSEKLKADIRSCPALPQLETFEWKNQKHHIFYFSFSLLAFRLKKAGDGNITQVVLRVSLPPHSKPLLT